MTFETLNMRLGATDTCLCGRDGKILYQVASYGRNCSSESEEREVRKNGVKCVCRILGNS